MVNEEATNVLKMRVPLEDLGPALFNRNGESTSGQHCLQLAKRILTLEGFATFRYVAGFCHEPDPDDTSAVSRHGNSMASKDPNLPRLPMKPLKGVFAKTHLVTFLQMYKNGQIPEALSQSSGQPSGQSPKPLSQSMEELQDALDHGVYMHVFPWAVVRDHKPALIKLMAADNFDHGHGLADSEMRCIKAVRSAITASSQGILAVPPGFTQWDVVLRHVMQMAGQRWREQDIGHFWDFAKSTVEAHFQLQQDIWSFAGCEAVLRVEAAWFGALAKISIRLQWTRTSVVVAHILSDKDKECSVVGGQCVAGAVAKSVVKKMRERDAASSQDWEEWVQLVMDRYWTAWDQNPDSRPVSRDVGLQAVAAFLDRAGRFAAYGANTDMSDRKAKFEAKLRSALEAGWKGPLPDAVTALSQEKKKSVWTDNLDAEPIVVADAKGKVVVTVKREAQDKNLDVGASVVVKRRRTGPSDEERGTIIDITDQGIKVSWEGGSGDPKSAGGSEVVSVSQVELAKVEKPKQAAASSQDDPLKQEAVKWSECSTTASRDMLLHLTASTLYQAYVARSSAHEDLHIVNNNGVVKLYAQRDMKQGALVLLPFGDVVEPSTASAGSIPISLEIGGEEPERADFRIRSKTTPKKTASSQEKAVVLVPFWVLATKPASSQALSKALKTQAPSASSQDPSTSIQEDGKTSGTDMSQLQYKTTAMQVPPPPAVEKRSARSKTSIVLKCLCLTNAEPVRKGSWLVVMDKPPVKLE